MKNTGYAFVSIPIGGYFTIDGEKMKKTGVSTYVSVENPVLGEVTIQPITEAKIRPLTGKEAPMILVSAKFSSLKVGTEFAIGRDRFRKTGTKTYVSTDGHWPGTQTITQLADSQLRIPKPAPVAPKAAPAKKIVAKPVAKKSVAKK